MMLRMNARGNGLSRRLCRVAIGLVATCVALGVCGPGTAWSDEARPSQGAVVLNVRVEPMTGAIVRIRYDLLAADPGATFVIAADASVDGGNTYGVKLRSLIGDLGPGIKPGTGKSILWDVGKDVGQVKMELIKAKITVVEEGVSPAPEPPPPAPDPGRVLVTSSPSGATVTILGVVRGTTPYELTDVPGTYRLMLSKPGYLDYAQTLNLRSAQRDSLEVELTPIPQAAAPAPRPMVEPTPTPAPTAAPAQAAAPAPVTPVPGRAAAQTTTPLSAGVKAGVNLGSLSGLDPADIGLSGGSGDTVGRTGFVLGGFFAISLVENIAFQTEILFVQKGGGVSGTQRVSGQTVSIKATINAQYLEIPLLVKLSAKGPAGVRPYVFGGPSIGFKLSAKINVKGSASGASVDVEEDFSDEVKASDFGIVFGGGVGFGRFLTEARYTAGLSDLSVEGEGIKSRSLAVLAGIRF